jgi:hypothetical protein
MRKIISPIGSLCYAASVLCAITRRKWLPNMLEMQNNEDFLQNKTRLVQISVLKRQHVET